MKYRRILIIFIFLLFCYCNTYSQENKFIKQDFDFASYLIGNNLKEEAITLIKEIDSNTYSQDIETKDSINFLKAWVLYSNKKLIDASVLFEKVNKASMLYPQTVFFNSISNAHLGNYEKADRILSDFEDSLGNYSSIYNLEKAGLSLLKRDFNSFNYYKEKFTYDNFATSQEEKALEEIYNSFKSHKKKSPFVAGMLSALVPGLGKIYAGAYGEGVSSFLLIGSLGAITAENWIRNGVLNWKTLVFGTIGMVFYIGNIYGSISSVKIYYEDFNHQQNISILYNIHIPLRTFFN